MEGGEGAIEKRSHLVNWSTICMNKGKGGWGIRTLSNLNKTLLGKWCWRFATKKGILLEESDYMGKHSEE